ncbi:ATPase [Pantoea sp. DY-15]|uniref:ATPase n=1 Tax=unclassified Pantoea TaxID=2630326 RepID=UPI001C98393F|nr:MULTISPECIES: ATPase [unclassified Pantoea]MBY4836662.1 ATPase [Pantoea sp. DY-5]MBY4887911.1 ATPase [Pantoea sp. DY-15]
MENNNRPAANAMLDKKENTTVTAEHNSGTVYFCPATEELVFISDTVSGDFERQWSELIGAVDNMHQSGENYSQAIEKYGVLFSEPARSAECKAAEDAAAEAQADYESKKEALKEKLGDFTPKGYEEVVELIPVKTRGRGRHNGPGSRYVYVKKGYYDQMGRGARHNVRMNRQDRNGASKSIFDYDADGNRTGISGKKIKEGLKDFDIKEIELFKIDADDIGKIDVTLTDWAESWNNSLFVDGQRISENIDVSAGAQFLRFTANAGASGEFSMKGGRNLSIKGEASSTLTIASGEARMTCYYPDRVGWSLKFESEIIPIDMGMFRMFLEPSLTGFIGASVHVEGQLEVVTVGTTQRLRGREHGGRLPPFHERRTTGRVFHEQMNEGDEGVTLSGEAFAGAKVTAALKGGFQWLQPKAATQYQNKTDEEAKKVSEFVDFCTISGDITGLVGIGIGSSFYCTFINGKFIFKIAASLCCGLGAKGSFLLEVAYEKLWDFGSWLVYQLSLIDYRKLTLISKEAFEAFSQICVMLLSDMKNSVESMLTTVSTRVSDITNAFKDFGNDLNDGLKASYRRNAIAENINAFPQRMLMLTPESKGNLLWLLSRHGQADHLDTKNRSKMLIDIYPERKEAVINVLNSIQTKREWKLVFLRMNEKGRAYVNELSVDADNKAEEMEETIIDFLQEGFNRDKDLKDIKARLIVSNIYKGLKESPASGYALAMNNTMDYKLAQGVNLHYPQMGDFGPLDHNQAYA